MQLDWWLLGERAGLGLLLGLAVGYTVKKALRAALVVVGLLVTALVALSRAGFVKVDWQAVEQAYSRAMDQVGGPPGLFQGLLGWFSGGLAVTGGFAVGFWVGFRLG